MSAIDHELAGVLKALRSQHDVLPFMQQMLGSGEIRLAQVPPDMMAIIESSDDYRPLLPGAPPTWFQINAESGHAELVIYRASSDGACYVIAPRRD